MDSDRIGLTRRVFGSGLLGLGFAVARGDASAPAEIALPAAELAGGALLARTMQRRRSVRRWRQGPLELSQVALLLWAAQGVTDAAGLRTAPSAGALYPLEIDLVARRVEALATGLYRYLPVRHSLWRRAEGDRFPALAAAAHDQGWLAGCAALLAISAIERRTASKYGARAGRYVAIEVGCAAQNAYLAATALGLGTTLVGAFDEDRVARLLELEPGCRPLALLPVGRR